MTKALIFIIALIGLTACFKKASEWFDKNKGINILPGALVEMVAVIIFMFTYGSEYNNDVTWMWVSIAVVLAVTIFNLIRHGLKDGILASLAELVFSISAAFLLACILVTSGREKKNR